MKKPLPVRTISGGYRVARSVGLHPFTLEKDRLRAQASKSAGGLTDFGDPRYEVGLDALLASIEDEHRLSGFGRLLATGHLTNLLKQRLLITAHLEAHPEVFDERIERPIFIIGAPRTGTTITHHLLSQDVRFRYPYTWECDELHPPLDPTTMATDPRVERSAKNVARVLKLAPGLEDAHPQGAWEAQECALLHAYQFMSATFEMMFNCQGYDHWLVEQDLHWVYEQEKVMLQYMQSGGLRPRESWLLKTPPHMENIDTILDVFPDARFITTYREPTEVVASSCSLAANIIGLAEDDLDRVDLGRHLTWRLDLMFRRNVELRKQFHDRPDQFIDFPMQEMVGDPLACVHRIYEHFGIELTDQARRSMAAFMGGRTLAKRRPHVYDAGDYGLDIAALWPNFQFYRDYYGIKET